MNILVVAAHPDDEVLGMGGTITKYTKSGHHVKILIIATGIAARRSTNYKNRARYQISKKEEKEILKQIKSIKEDAKKAAKIMGVKDIQLEDFPDNELDTVSNLELTKVIESVIEKFDPKIVYTHSPYDVNVDHRLVYDATLTATRPKTQNRVKEVISFEVPSSTEWYFPSSFQPNIFIEISKELKLKQKAIQAYKTEIKKFPHPRSIESLEIIGKRWGIVSGLKVAEAFSLVRELRNNI